MLKHLRFNASRTRVSTTLAPLPAAIHKAAQMLREGQLDLLTVMLYVFDSILTNL